ncbi:unnamed protein product [Clonostachys rosea f. rosea IK726]|jgi:hypothetical protein|uniref:Uncharacterized protein n=1 Tax=Clonostachys rosea f. rosea IK726 TaxID=1349383 RepID=A0ACA9UIK0_BIOOC|nr:unnamed protein product [Clonostachys rosea f. rosea IK726]
MTQDGSWDSAPADALLATDDAGFFGFNANAAEDGTSRVASSLPNQDLEKYIYGPVEGSSAKSTLGNHSASRADCRPTLHMTGDNTQSRPLSLPPISIQESHLQSPGSTSNSSIKSLGGNWLSPLHMAAKKGSDRIISMLLRHKSDCNEPDSDGLRAQQSTASPVTGSILIHLPPVLILHP